MTQLPADEFYVEPATWKFDRPELEKIRIEVFMQEQGVPEEDEWDEYDSTAGHFLARSIDGQTIGTARLTKDGRIGRIAVVRAWRGRGVGAALLRSAIEAGRSQQFAELRLAAQTHALAFYQKRGFSAYGSVFDDAGIPHKWMRMPLKAPEPRSDGRHRRKSGAPPDKSFIEFDGLNEAKARMRQLVDYTSNQLVIYSRNLDGRILDTGPVMDAIRELATCAPKPLIRVLVQDSSPAVESGHRLIHLGHRLPSVLQFRKPSKVHLDYISAFAVGDSNHVLFRPFGDRFEGYLQVNHRYEARRLMDYFNQVWDDAEAEPNLRRLDL